MRQTKLNLARGLLWATLAVAWLLFNPFFHQPALQAKDDLNTLPAKSAAAKKINLHPLSAGIPVHLEIPAIKVAAAIQPVGTTPARHVGIPSNYTDAGWWRGGAVPGASGTALVVGHVNNYFGGPAVFTDLKKLTPGDKIRVTDDQGNVRRFIVREVALVPYDNFPVQKIFGTPGQDEAYLNLITCAGTWLPDKKLFDQRLVVFSQLIEAAEAETTR